MRNHLYRWFTFILIVFLSCPLPPPIQAANTITRPADEILSESPPADPPPVWPPAEITFGILTDDEETQGLGDILIPLWNPGERGLLFVNPRAAITDDNEDETNIGIGWRQLLPGDKVILGANAYYDYRDTGDRTYDQWGVGFEILSTWIDARANYYHPDDDPNLIASETETSTRQSSSSSSSVSAPYAEDHYILQDYTTTRTLTTVTSTRTFEQFEAAYGGYDWEIGLRLPLPVQPETLEARIFGGMYDFDREYNDEARGWKARAELRLLSSLFVDGGLYEDDELTGSDWFVGARLSVPLDLPRIAQGRNPFSTAQSRLNAAPRDLSARLTEMVMRDTQIRIETSGFIENPDLFSETITRDQSSDTQTLALLADVNFVYGDTVQPLQDGSAEYPFSTIQLGVDNVFGSRNVYVYDTLAPYEENVVLTEGVTLWGSGVLVPGIGAAFGSGTHPIVDGLCRGPTITLADDTTVLGFQIQNTGRGCDPVRVDLPVIGSTDVGRVGILGNDATGLILTENIITGNAIGALLTRQGDFRMHFSNSQVANNDDSGVVIQARGNSGTFQAVIDDSTFAENAGDGLRIDAATYDESTIQASNSRFRDNTGNGLWLRQADSGQAAAALVGVEATGNGARGLVIRAEDNDEYLAGIRDAALRTSGTDGFQLYVSGNTAAGVTVASSAFEDNPADGARFDIMDNGQFTGILQSNSFARNEGNGLAAEVENNANAGIGIENSTFADNTGHGAAFRADGNDTFGGASEDSTFSGNGLNGLGARLENNDEAGIGIAGSTFADNTGHGAAVEADGNDTFTGVIEGSTFSGNGEDGFGAQLANNTGATLAIADSTFADNTRHGTAFRTENLDTFAATVEDSTFSGSGGHGFYAQADNIATAAIGIGSSRFADNTGSGADFLLDNNETFIGTIEDSTFAGNGVNGLAARADTQLNAGFSIEDSTFTDNGANGAAFLAENSGTFVVMAEGSAFSGNEGNGFSAELADNDNAGIHIAGSTFADNEFHGADLEAEDNGLLPINVEGSTFTDNGGEGLALQALRNDTVSVAIATSTFADNTGDGAQILAASNGPFQAMVEDSTFADNGANGMELRTDDNVPDNLLFDGNRFADNGAAGLLIQGLNSAEMARTTLSGAYFSATIIDSTFTGNTGAGLDLYAAGYDTSLADVRNSTFTGNGADGALIQIVTNDEAYVMVSGSQATGNTGTGFNAGIESAGPGEIAFSNVVASQNGGMGASAAIQNVMTGQVDVTGMQALMNTNDGLAVAINADTAIARISDSEASQNGALGFGLDLTGTAESTAELTGLTADENQWAGLTAHLTADTNVNAMLNNIQAGSNASLHGVRVEMVNAESSVADLSGITANGNAGAGIEVVQTSNLFALVQLSGSRADGNGTNGIHVAQMDGLLSIANISGSSANGNAAAGVRLEQDNDLASIGVIGMPEGFGDMLTALTANFGLTLPDEVIAFFAAEGPVIASGNTGPGVDATIQTPFGISLASLFDITANGNGAQGIQANVTSDTGIAATIGGSSTNLNDMLALADNLIQLLGTNLPLSIAGTDRMEAHNNAETGVNLTTVGGLASLTAMTGIWATNNGGYGVIAQNISDGLSLTDLARVTATDNSLGGVQMTTFASNLAAIGLLVDVNASNNDGNGIDAQIQSPEGAAVLLTLSTDALRPLGTWLGNEFLGGPFVIPGEPFGPVTASGNDGQGFMATVNGHDFAMALLLDTVASGNDGNGIDLTVDSEDGSSVVGMLSTDLLYSFVSDALSLTPPIVTPPLGLVTANNNGAIGIRVSQEAQDGVYSLLAGVEASGNTTEGINQYLVSNTGDIYSILAGVATDGNLGGSGMNLELNAPLGQTVSALIGVSASGNASNGISVTQNNPTDDAVALLIGAQTASNANHGLDYNLMAGDDASVLMTAVTSEYNTDLGGNFSVTAGDEIRWLGGSDLTGLAAFDPTVSNILDAVDGLIPMGASTFRNNTGNGLQVDLESANGNILALLDGGEYSGNSRGATFELTALNGSILGGLFNITASSNVNVGARIRAYGAGTNAALSATNSTFIANGANGLVLYDEYNGPVAFFGESITAINNTDNGVRIRPGGLAGLPIIDFGGGLLGSAGQGSIYGNGNRDFRLSNGGGAVAMAQSNWWGTATPAGGQFGGNVNYSNWLVVAP